MKAGETRKFKIDKAKKPDCKLPSNEISITKVKTDKEEKTHQVVGHEKEAYIDCYPGFVSGLEATGKTQFCGIGKILMRLCLAEQSIHNTEKKETNRAMQNILTDSTKNFPKLAKWVTSTCSKIIFLTMRADPVEAAFVYFNSAIEAGYTEMFINLGVWKQMYPKYGPCPVKLLKKQYRAADGKMVNGGEVVKVWGEHWYFCLPKKPSPHSKCTTLN